MTSAATIGSLRVNLGLDSAEFQNGLKKAQGSLAGFGKVATLGLAAAAAAAAGAAIAIGGAIKASIDAADDMLIASQKIGVGVEALSALKYAADLSAVSFDQLQTGLKKLSVNMADTASKGTGPAADAFRALGISVTDTNGNLRSSDAVFADVAEKFAGMENGAGKTALAVQLFGKAGADLIPLLNEGKVGLAEMKDEAAALGLIISTETAEAAESFNDNLDKLKMVGSGVTNQLAAELAPALNDVTAGLVEAVKGSGLMKGIGQALSVTLKALGTAAIVVGQNFAAMGRALSTISKIVRQVFAGDFAGAMDTYRASIVENLKSLQQSGQAIRTIWTGAGQKAKAVAEESSDGMAAPIARAAEKATTARKVIESEADKAVKALRDRLAAAQKERANEGLSPELVKARENLAAANEALKLGESELAEAFIDLATSAAVSTEELQQVAAAQEALIRIGPEAGRATTSWSDEFLVRLEEVERQFYDAADAAAQLFHGIRTDNWISALRGAVRVVDQLKIAFDRAASASSRISAAAGVAQSVGDAIGGKAGGALSGAASGAAAGATFGPWGAVIGGVLGGLGGLFGASKAKKRAKKEAARRAEEERLQKAAQLAAASRALDIELLRHQGKAQEALNVQREDELAAADPTLRERMKALYALQDQAEAEAKLAEVRTAQRDIARELLRLTDEGAASEADRLDILAAMPESLRDLQRAFWAVTDAQDALTAAEEARDDAVAAAQGRIEDARDGLREAYEAEAATIEDTKQRFSDLADELAALNAELSRTDLGGLTPDKQLAATRAEFDRVAGRSDAASLAALPQASRDYLAALRATAPNQRALTAGIADVRRAVIAGEAAARGQVSVADQQLLALQASVSGLITLNATTLSVKSALDVLAETLIQASADQQAAFRALEAAQNRMTEALAQANTANDNVVIPGFDAAGVSSSLTSMVPPAVADAVNTGVSKTMVATLEAVMVPLLYPIAKNTGLTAELAQLQRDEADAA